MKVLMIKIRDQGIIISSVKNQIVNSLRFMGHMVSVPITQLCHVAWKQPETI